MIAQPHPLLRPDGRPWPWYRLQLLRLLYAGRRRVLCAICDQPVTQEEATLDHKLAISLGGVTELANLQVTCSPCNDIKSEFEYKFFRMVRRGRRPAPSVENVMRFARALAASRGRNGK